MPLRTRPTNSPLQRAGRGGIAAAAALTLALTACSSSSTSSSSAPPSLDAKAGVCGTSQPTTLTVGLFGTFGYKENGLYSAYKKLCPNVTIKEDDVEQSADYWTKVAELSADDWARDVYFSPGDAGRFFADAVQAPAWPGYAVVYATSRPQKQTIYDLEPSRVLLGYEPHDHWPMGVEDMLLGEVAKITAPL